MKRALVFFFLAVLSREMSLNMMSAARAAPVLASQTSKVVPSTIVPVRETYDYLAVFARPVKIEGLVIASGIAWQCQGNMCTTSGPWPTPGVGACTALAEKVGEIVSYGYVGNLLSKADLVACNRGVATGDTVAPPSRAAGPPWTVTTDELSAVGGQITVTVFRPITIETAELSAVGGAITSTKFAPVTVTTGELSAVGK